VKKQGVKKPKPTASKKREFRRKNTSKVGMGGPGAPGLAKKRMKDVMI
jgi:dihydroxyacetone kinase